MSKKIERETLIDELQRVADVVDGPPTMQDLREHGEHSRQPYFTEFGNWTKAKEAAGVGVAPNQRMETTREDLLDELQRLADELGRTPTKAQMHEHGEYSRSPYEDRFGSWNGALRAAGLDVNKPSRTDLGRETLLDELRRLATELGHVPTQRDMDTQGQYSRRPYLTEFGEWNAALEAADMDLNKPHDIDFPTKTCPECDTTFPVKPSRENYREYCSRSCLASSRTGEDNPHPNAGKRVTLVCEWCGDEYPVVLSKKDSSRFCSPECVGQNNKAVRSGPDSPRWRGGYEEYYGPMWDEKRHQRMGIDGYTCQSCGSKQDLVVHHKTPFREFVYDDGTADYEAAHAMDNLVTLCRSCHMNVENDRMRVD